MLFLLFVCLVNATYPDEVDHSIVFPSGGALSRHSVTGFIPISTQSQIFYWLFLSDEDAVSKPVVVWLQGQIGVSSLVGVFEEFTPEWTQSFNLLFVDAPLGTGFSETQSEYATSSEEVAAQVVTFLDSFFLRHAGQTSKNVILAGEDYAGHTIPVIAALALHRSFRLLGTAVGNGHTHAPIQVITKAKSAAMFGLIDGKCLLEARQHALAASVESLAGEYLKSLEERNALEETILSCSPGVNMGHIDLTSSRTSFGVTQKILANPTVVNALTKSDKIIGVKSEMVFNNLKADIMRPIWQYLPSVMEEVPTLWYQGQLDWVDGVYSNQAWLNALQWYGAAEYAKSSRTVCPAGYMRNYKTLTEVMVRGAGHLALKEKPSEILNLFQAIFKSPREELVVARQNTKEEALLANWKSLVGISQHKRPYMASPLRTHLAKDSPQWSVVKSEPRRQERNTASTGLFTESMQANHAIIL